MSNRVKASIGFVIVALILVWNWLYFFCEPEEVQVDLARADIPTGLTGMRIIQISDYHNGSWLWEDDALLERMAAFEPDYIVLTGDMVDGHTGQYTEFLDMAHKMTGIAPVYAVMGNHEGYLDEAQRADFIEQTQAQGVEVLVNEAVRLQYNGQAFCLAGVDDPTRDIRRKMGSFFDSNADGIGLDTMREYMQQMHDERDPELFTILLSHQPFYYPAWAESGVNVTLSGHMHGGVVRIGGRGLVKLHRNSYFPEADAGLYEKDGVTVYISRGMSLSYYQPRVNNPPEMTLIELVGTAQ